ncbi:hypothetical protein PHLGIDRAFT_271612 [Phlebiopsis gigantea 11061_1 CR5-6]|uniref:Uncharacterized protein n=1 Tax=Phlebiopsis gigantea (strain 11061_1 CR5-6) TaxID=745531 RepID=A0A0C3S152_PHLG1|nr:hypothetical protein PHLGIDRAFT_271612 [Phlebiopsis gigantea 11061_1 CR5-6]
MAGGGWGVSGRRARPFHIAAPRRGDQFSRTGRATCHCQTEMASARAAAACARPSPPSPPAVSPTGTVCGNALVVSAQRAHRLCQDGRRASEPSRPGAPH